MPAAAARPATNHRPVAGNCIVATGPAGAIGSPAMQSPTAAVTLSEVTAEKRLL
jgi:hypothetical protein